MNHDELKAAAEQVIQVYRTDPVGMGVSLHLTSTERASLLLAEAYLAALPLIEQAEREEVAGEQLHAMYCQCFGFKINWNDYIASAQISWNRLAEMLHWKPGCEPKGGE